jgi:hypothetical protein
MLSEQPWSSRVAVRVRTTLLFGLPQANVALPSSGEASVIVPLPAGADHAYVKPEVWGVDVSSCAVPLRVAMPPLACTVVGEVEAKST